MGLQPKELNKVISVLSNDSLVKIYRQNELKEGAQRSVGKQYYYIDYEHFCNVVKWRIARMRSIIDTGLRNELMNKGYICPQCKTSYSPLEVDKLMDFSRNALICEICHAEVIDNENAETVQGSQDRMQRFNHQMRFIRDGLQKSEAMILPAFDVAAWVKNNPSESDKQKAAQSGSGLKIAGSDPNKKEDEGVGIMLVMDKDESTRRQERDAEADLKRQQNVLPAWHLKSTITGELTALGVIESARTEILMNGSSTQVSNDDILKGLGVIGGGPSKQQQQQQQQPVINLVEDVKPTINRESDLYDQYYASLAASSAAVSALPTPTAQSVLGSSDSGDFGYDEEEDRKPSVQYLDSLNAYRKRSRSHEDVGSAAKIKQIKVDATEGIYGIGNGVGVVINGYTPENGIEVEQDAVMVGDVALLPEDDPMVYVNGAPKPYSQVTEDDHELMTPEEYTAFFNILQARS